MSQHPILKPGIYYHFWNGNGNASPALSQPAILISIKPNKHRAKYVTDIGTFDFVSLDRPLVDGKFTVKLIQTEKKDPKTGEMIPLTPPIQIFEMHDIHATNAFHLWELMWYSFSSFMEAADTFDSDLLSQINYSDYLVQP